MIPKAYKEPYFVCRSDGHSWTHESTQTTPVKGQVHRILYCAQHEGFRIDVVDYSSGTVLKRRYVMPKGYYVTGMGKPSRSEFRRVLIRKELRDGKR